MSRYAALARRVAALDAAGLRRVLRTVRPTSATTAVLDGRTVDLFCTNDYLGLAADPAIQAIRLGGGAGGARLISGTRPAHAAIEARLEAMYGRPALFFPSGSAANLALFSTLASEGPVASDALNHASIIDGLRLGGAQRHILTHLGTEVPSDTRTIALESLYSMDGDVPDLRAYPRGPWLALDEAHAFGALGPGGRGLAAAQGVDPDFLVVTFGKALGVAGAAVIGPPELRTLLVSAGRAFVYATASPPGIAKAALLALDLADDALRERLAENAARLRSALAARGVPAGGEHHIVPVPTGPHTMAVAAALLDAGVLAPGIRAPTVPSGTERIRLTVSARHTADQIERCAEALAEAWSAARVRGDPDPARDGAGSGAPRPRDADATPPPSRGRPRSGRPPRPGG